MCQGQQNGSEKEREREREWRSKQCGRNTGRKRLHPQALTTATPKIYCGDLFALSITYFYPLHQLSFPPSHSLSVRQFGLLTAYLFIHFLIY